MRITADKFGRTGLREVIAHHRAQIARAHWLFGGASCLVIASVGLVPALESNWGRVALSLGVGVLAFITTRISQRRIEAFGDAMADVEAWIRDVHARIETDSNARAEYLDYLRVMRDDMRARPRLIFFGRRREAQLITLGIQRLETEIAAHEAPPSVTAG